MDTVIGAQLFHEEHLLPISYTPAIPDKKDFNPRFQVLVSELNEVMDAIEAKDIVSLLHELTDVQYALDSLYVLSGLQQYKQVAFELVHEANMRKRWPDGEIHYNEQGKVIKPPGFVPADLSTLLKE